MTDRSVFDRQRSLQVKGVAVVLLVLHHMFLFPSTPLWFTSIMPGGRGEIEFFLSSVGKLCIPLFFFVSGFGHWMSSRQDACLWRTALRRLVSVYVSYLMAVMVTVLLLFWWQGRFPLLSLRHGLATALGLNVSINGSWWFLIVYVEMVLLTPLAVRLVLRFSWQPLLLGAGFLYLFSGENGIPVLVRAMQQIGLTPYLYENMPVNLFWSHQLYFFTGFCLAASGHFEGLLRRTVSRLPTWQRLSLGLLLGGAVFGMRYSLVPIGRLLGVVTEKQLDIFQYTTLNTQVDFLLGPLLIFALVLLLHRQRLLLLTFLGRYSAAIWLLHGGVLVVVKGLLHPYRLWSPLLFALILALCSIYALGCEWVQRFALRIFRGVFSCRGTVPAGRGHPPGSDRGPE